MASTLWSSNNRVVRWLRCVCVSQEDASLLCSNFATLIVAPGLPPVFPRCLAVHFSCLSWLHYQQYTPRLESTHYPSQIQVNFFLTIEHKQNKREPLLLCTDIISGDQESHSSNVEAPSCTDITALQLICKYKRYCNPAGAKNDSCTLPTSSRTKRPKPFSKTFAVSCGPRHLINIWDTCRK